MQEEFTQILLNAQNINLQIRQEAEQKIQNARDSNPVLLTEMLVKELNDEEKPIKSRHLAGIVLKNMLISKNKRQREILANEWISYDENHRTNIKTLLYKSFNSESHIIRNTAAMVLSEIALIEIPKNCWGTSGISDMLNNIEKTTNPDLKETLLTFLSYIFEDIPFENIESQISDSLRIICQELENQNESIKKSAIKAFIHLISLSEKKLTNIDDINFIINLILQGIQDQNIEIASLFYESLIKFATVFYQYLSDSIQKIFNILISSITNPDSQLCIKAIEFWTSICEKELEIQTKLSTNSESKLVYHNFISQVASHLIPYLFENLQNEYELDENEWDPSKASVVCISSITSVIGDSVISIVSSLIETNLTSSSQKQQESAIICFGSILENTSTTKMKPVIEQGIPIFLELFNKSNQQISKWTSWTISRICQFHPESIINQINAMIETFFNGLTMGAEIAINICWCFHYLALGLGDPEKETGILSNYFQNIIENLFLASDRDDSDETNLRVVSYESIIMNVLKAPQDCLIVISKLVPLMIEKLDIINKLEVLSDSERMKQSQIQSNICGILQSSTLRLGVEISNISKQLLESLFNVLEIEESFAHQEAIMAIHSIMNQIGEFFSPNIPRFVEFLIRGLKSIYQQNLSQISVEVIGELFRDFPDYISSRSDEIINLILEILNFPEFEISTKICYFTCLADISISIQVKFEPYLDLVMEFAKRICELDFNQKNVEEIVNFYLLSKAAFEVFTGIIYGFSRVNQQSRIEKYIKQMASLIEKISTIPFEFQDVEILQSSCGLIGDIIQCFGNDMKTVFNPLLIKELIKMSLNTNDQNLIETAKWVSSIF
ncbi:importin subunit beta-1 [Anaeramoeba ignava]|uniref:Importin subunit beta-1 n=1 Tax=Anaeramoeba ignava TaxID=1746090 RepID=A0A9Q0LVP6_ANAIG|nr:importin subunit beta-1 [Anaeramoeba ignava]